MKKLHRRLSKNKFIVTERSHKALEAEVPVSSYFSIHTVKT